MAKQAFAGICFGLVTPSLGLALFAVLLASIAAGCFAFVNRVGRRSAYVESPVAFVAQSLVLAIACMCIGTVVGLGATMCTVRARIVWAQRVGDDIVDAYHAFHVQHDRWPATPAEAGVDVERMNPSLLKLRVVDRHRHGSQDKLPMVEIVNPPIGSFGGWIDRRVDEDRWTERLD